MVEKTLTQVLAAPSPALLWQLRADLLTAGMAADEPEMGLIQAYYRFLTTLSADTDTIDFNKIAYWMNVASSVTAIADEWLDSINVFALFRRLVPIGLDEVLDTLAAHQYVKAAETELSKNNLQAAWFLYDALWAFSAETNPELAPSTRREHLDSMFQVVFSENEPIVQSVIIGRLFQYLLLAYLAVEKTPER